jgi:hypothetical protein
MADDDNLTEMTLEERNEMFRRAYGEDAWEALRTESARLGRKLTSDEASTIVEDVRSTNYHRRQCPMGRARRTP